METAQAVPDWKAAADEIWAMLRESRKEAEERQREAEKRDEQNRKEAEKRDEQNRKEAEERRKEAEKRRQEVDLEMREIRENQKETDRIVKENARQLGGIHNRFGEIVEYMVAPNLKAKFREIGLSFQETSNDKIVEDNTGKFILEVDVFLENGDKALLVEAKSKPTTEDVNEHIKRLETMRAWADLKGDKRKFLGAIAGVVMTPKVREYILKKGFFAIEPSGETFNITQPQDRPREW